MRREIMAATIALDAGHGGYDGGAVNQGRKEKDDNLALTLAVGEYLQNNGVDVLYTRTEDVYDSPVRKAQIANESDADYFISFHRNSSPVPNQYSGVETLLYDENGIKKELADAVNANLAKVGFKNLGTDVRKDLAVLRRTRMPAILIETGFINSDTDNRIYDENFDAIAKAIGDAILTTLPEAGGGAGTVPGTTGSVSGGTAQAPAGSTQYAVQVGLFRNPENADRLYRELTALGIPAEVGNSGSFIAVRAGRTSSYNEAYQLQKELTELGFDTLIVTL